MWYTGRAAADLTVSESDTGDPGDASEEVSSSHETWPDDDAVQSSDEEFEDAGPWMKSGESHRDTLVFSSCGWQTSCSMVENSTRAMPTIKRAGSAFAHDSCWQR